VRCFNHPEREAIGSCKACSKGLCPDCVAAEDMGWRVAVNTRSKLTPYT
jgi:hypothetical protein